MNPRWASKGRVELSVPIRLLIPVLQLGAEHKIVPQNAPRTLLLLLLFHLFFNLFNLPLHPAPLLRGLLAPHRGLPGQHVDEVFLVDSLQNLLLFPETASSLFQLALHIFLLFSDCIEQLYNSPGGDLGKCPFSISLKGVVQLFNAVREQQKDMKSQLKQAGGSFRKQEKVLKTINKENFISMLSGKATVRSEEPAEKRSRVEREVEEEEEEVEEKEEKQSSWSILRDDFMLGAKLKDWDQESDGD